MDQKYFDEIKAREQAATSGPWEAVEHGNTVKSHAIVAINPDISIIPIAAGISPKAKDATFISHARTDIPALLAEVERLQKIVKMQKASCSLVKTVEAGKIADENATLKKALELACKELNLSPVEKVFAPNYFIHQAQEQEGKK